MANGKQGARPTLSIKNKSDTKAKSRVEEMFGGTQQANSTAEEQGGAAPVVHVEATIPLPEHADAGEVKSIKDVIDRIDAFFDSIGTDNLADTKVPAAKDNRGPEAAEFVVAQRLKKRAEARYDKAKAAAEEVGCFGSADQYVSGETVEVYRSGSFTFSVQRNRDSEVVDKTATEEVLRAVAPSKWRELLSKCKKLRKGATQYIVALK